MLASSEQAVQNGNDSVHLNGMNAVDAAIRRVANPRTRFALMSDNRALHLRVASLKDSVAVLERDLTMRCQHFSLSDARLTVSDANLKAASLRILNLEAELTTLKGVKRSLLRELDAFDELIATFTCEQYDASWRDVNRRG